MVSYLKQCFHIIYNHDVNTMVFYLFRELREMIEIQQNLGSMEKTFPGNPHFVLFVNINIKLGDEEKSMKISLYGELFSNITTRRR